MNTSDIILIVTTLILGIIAIFTPWISEKMKRKFFGPSLSISFVEEPPYCIMTHRRKLTSEESTKIFRAYYFRFLVENTGQSTLKNCEAMLEEIWFYDEDGTPKKFRNFQNVNLYWVNPHKSLIDIRPNRKHFCNIGHIESPENQQDEFMIPFTKNNDPFF